MSVVVAPDHLRIPAYDLPQLAVGRARDRQAARRPGRTWTTPRTARPWPSAPTGRRSPCGPRCSRRSWAPAPGRLSPSSPARGPPTCARTRCTARARGCCEAGDRPGARATLGSAITEAEKIEAGLIVQRAQGLIDRAGLTGRGGSAEAPRGGASSAAGGVPDTLTPREQQVLALVAEGLTNGQIAERLYISAKTASVHVSAILRKLGVSTRTEAALRVPR